MKNKLSEIYTTIVTEIKNGDGEWSYLQVEIFKEGLKIGEYKRDYSSFFKTFFPFSKNGKEYALYSKNYMTTSVMSLPACEHMCDTLSQFCPTDYYVPDFAEFYQDMDIHKLSLKEAIKKGDKKEADLCSSLLLDMIKDEKHVGKYALVSGCVWGDDSGGWKVRMLDISEIENGKIEINENLGYFELPETDHSLAELIIWEEPTSFNIPLNMRFDISDDKMGFNEYYFKNIKLYK